MSTVNVVSVCEEAAVRQTTADLDTADFRVCTLLPCGTWKVERVSTERMALILLPGEEDDDHDVSMVIIQVRRSPVKKSPRVKVIAAHPGWCTAEMLGKRHVPRLIGMLKHPAVLNKYRSRC